MRKKYVKLLVGMLAFLLAGVFYCFSYYNKEEAEWETGGEETEREILSEVQTEGAGEKRTIFVHICGEVNLPGVYEVAEGCRLYELLELAGGATEEGTPDALNLADILSDGQRVVIPSAAEAAAMAAETAKEGTGLVNLNTASVQQLMTLPGIGEAKAKDIVQYREKNGSFQKIEDIMKISGIKEAVFQKIQSLITV